MGGPSRRSAPSSRQRRLAGGRTASTPRGELGVIDSNLSPFYRQGRSPCSQPKASRNSGQRCTARRAGPVPSLCWPWLHRVPFPKSGRVSDHVWARPRPKGEISRAPSRDPEHRDFTIYAGCNSRPCKFSLSVGRRPWAPGSGYSIARRALSPSVTASRLRSTSKPR
jgi:hypothetical protein